MCKALLQISWMSNKDPIGRMNPEILEQIIMTADWSQVESIA
jgi:hypothetical protein